MSKHTSPIHLLAIDPGSRYLGVAVFEDLFLLNWRTQIIEDKGRSAQAAVSRVRQIVRQSIKEHHVTMVVVRPYCPCPRHTSKVVAAMVKEIQRFGKQQGLRVSLCDPQRARKFLCQGTRATKMEVARIISTDRYPHPLLRHIYEETRAKPWFREKYHLQMFSAIALGLYALSKCQHIRLSSEPHNEVH